MAEQSEMKFWNPDLPEDERIDDLIGRLTLEEKAAQMVHNTPAIDRLGIPEYNWWSECLHGVARAGRATVFPQSLGLAATFDTDLMHRVATATSDEARAKHHQAAKQGNRRQNFGLTCWSPNVNIFRDPRWGRGQETYGEDPYLSARMGVAFCKGLQGDDPKYLKTVATPKHYAVHSGPEPKRHTFDARVNQRDLRETYLPAFKACVQEAKAFSVMGAYNRTNGEACCASPTLLEKILREEWGFEGYVVSDCGAIRDLHEHHKLTSSPAESAAMAVKNGCELNCGRVYPMLVRAANKGLITEDEIDNALRRLLRARFRLGMFDPEDRVPYTKIPTDVVECEEHRHLAAEAASKSMVLLKNQDNLLPLRKDLVKIGVVGPTAYNLRMQHANYYGYSAYMTTILEGILAKASPGTDVVFEQVCSLAGNEPVDEHGIGGAANGADVIIAVMGFTAELEGEEGLVNTDAQSEGGGDRTRINLPGRQEEALKKLVETGKPVVLVVTSGSPVDLSWAAENCAAIVMAWYPGQAGDAVADVLFGDVNPAGRLPMTFVKSMDQLPDFEDYAMANRTYRFMGDEPLYRFGYGLSYTSFEYSDIRLSSDKISPGESVSVTVNVTNTGRRAGDEVVQLYVSDVEASVPVPLRHLEGFRRLRLAPGETKTVGFTLTGEQLSAYDDEGNPFVEPGEFRIAVGGGQPEDPAAGAVTTTLTVAE
ncbi:MAG: glycoside hydrolase family 3 C-terminal domain-containing protein [Phycisphaerae bacterium]